MAVDLLETAPVDPAAGWTDAQIGRYILRRFVGAGGMGVVVAAHDPELDREVAIKIVAGGEATPIREAQAMARLSHPNVVQVYEVIRLGERTAIVMELVEGEELGAWQRERPWRAIVDAYVQASRGLAAAHRAGIVHRDFKPSNALVDRGGVVRVTDFGVARAASEAPDETTSVGTPVYMAPEQHRKGVVDARTDQWALGCALYEALYGRRPFASAEGNDLAAAVTGGKIESEPASSPVPRRIRAAIRRALATEPDDRFASVDELAAAISRRPRHVPYLVGAGIAIAIALPVVMLARSGEPAACSGLDAPMRAVWTDATRAELRARLLAPGVGLPTPTVDRALQGIDMYTASWSTMRTRTCTDSKQGVRSAATLDARMRCLDHRLAEVTGLLEGLAGGDAKTLRAASDAVAQLRELDDCDGELATRPSSPAIETAEDELARAIALVSLGQYERAMPLVERGIATGEQANAPSLLARALVVRGECEDRLGDYEPALASYRRGAKAAAQAREHTVLADALARAFLVEGDHLGRRADALRNRPFIELALDSAGQPDDVRAEWLHFLAILLYDDPSLVEEAVGYERESLALRQRTLPAGHVYILDSIETLANIEAARKNFDEASGLLKQVLDARIASRGPNDAMVSSAYNNLGVVEIRRNEYLAALAYLVPAVEIARASGKPNSGAIFNLGITQLELGRSRAAVDTFALSLEAAEQMQGKTSRHVAESSIFLGIANIAAGEIERGRPLLLGGLEGARRVGSPMVTTGISHAALLALHDGDRQKARALLDEAAKLPATNAPLRTLAGAELARVEAGCAAARASYAAALESAIAVGERRVQSRSTIGLSACELAAGDTKAARARLEAELAWLEKVGADETAKTPLRALLRQ